MPFLANNHSKNTYLPWLLGALVFILAVAGAWYFFLANENGISGVTGTPSNIPAARSVNTGFQSEVFQSQKFQELKSHGRLPVESGTKGMVNPFSAPSTELPEEINTLPQGTSF